MATLIAQLGTAKNPRRVDRDELPDEIVRELYDYSYKPGEQLEDLHMVFGFNEDFLPASITVLRHKHGTRLVATLKEATYSPHHRGWLCIYGVEVEAD